MESTGFVRTEFTDDPLARFALASSACAAPAALPWALAPERSAVAAPWPVVCVPVVVWLLSSGPKVLGRRIVSKAPRAVNCLWPETGAASEVKGSTWNRADGLNPLNHPALRSASSRQLTLRLRGLGDAGEGFRTRTRRAFHGEPLRAGVRRGHPPVSISGELRTHDSH